LIKKRIRFNFGQNFNQMILKDFLPPLALRQYVQTYRVVRFIFDKNQPLPFKAFAPRPENCLMFFLRQPDCIQFPGNTQKLACSPIELIGQQTTVVNRFPSWDVLNFQIVFQPTALYKLLKIPAVELINQSLDGASVFPREVTLLHEQLQEAAEEYERMITLANEFITSLINKTKPQTDRIDKVSHSVLASGGNVSLDQLADAACLSIKQFRRKFSMQVGVTPHYYVRIARFIQAYHLRNRMPQLDWLTVALQTGYYDYQHLSKDYLEFTNQTPIGFHLLESRSPERVLGIADEVYKSR